MAFMRSLVELYRAHRFTNEQSATIATRARRRQRSHRAARKAFSEIANIRGRRCVTSGVCRWCNGLFLGVPNLLVDFLPAGDFLRALEHRSTVRAVDLRVEYHMLAVW